MARGWESKAIESQQDDAARGKALKPAMTPAQRERLDRKVALELSKARLTADLTRATAPHHRQMLERALADLDAQIASIG